MSISSDMQSLTAEIEASHEARATAVSEIVRETRQTLQDFKREHTEMTHELRHLLAASENARVKAYAPLIKDIKATVATLEQDVHTMLDDFHTDHAEMSVELKSDLSTFHSELSADTAKRHEERLRNVRDFQAEARRSAEARRRAAAERARETRAMLAEFRMEREKMARNWKPTTIAEQQRKRAKAPKQGAK